jgi:hypothetical protein
MSAHACIYTHAFALSMPKMTCRFHSDDALLTSPVLLQVIACHAAVDLTPVFSPTRRGCTRKIIVSTNVAETSLTIEGVCHVIDTGLAKVTSFDVVKRLPMLHTAYISQVGSCAGPQCTHVCETFNRGVNQALSCC